MLYALYVGFVTAFAAIAATGHVLLLMAVYPNVFSMPQREVSAAEVEFAPRGPAPPDNPKLAA
jgi:hypothetical protein